MENAFLIMEVNNEIIMDWMPHGMKENERGCDKCSLVDVCKAFGNTDTSWICLKTGEGHLVIEPPNN